MIVANSAALPEVGAAANSLPEVGGLAPLDWYPQARPQGEDGHTAAPPSERERGTERPGHVKQYGAAFGLRAWDKHEAEQLSGLHGVVARVAQLPVGDRQTSWDEQLRTARNAPLLPWDAGLVIGSDGGEVV